MVVTSQLHFACLSIHAKMQFFIVLHLNLMASIYNYSSEFWLYSEELLLLICLSFCQQLPEFCWECVLLLLSFWSIYRLYQLNLEDLRRVDRIPWILVMLKRIVVWIPDLYRSEICTTASPYFYFEINSRSYDSSLQDYES